MQPCTVNIFKAVIQGNSKWAGSRFIFLTFVLNCYTWSVFFIYYKAFHFHYLDTNFCKIFFSLSFVRRAIRLGLYTVDDPTPCQLVANMDDNLFVNILNNPHHVLDKFHPDRTNHTYNHFSSSLSVISCQDWQFPKPTAFKRHSLVVYELSWLHFVNYVIKEMMMMMIMCKLLSLLQIKYNQPWLLTMALVVFALVLFLVTGWVSLKSWCAIIMHSIVL